MTAAMKLASTKLAGNLPQLQNLIKRQPLAYRNEFLLQMQRFDAEIKIFRLTLVTPSGDGTGRAFSNRNEEDFGALAWFLSHCLPYYPDELSSFSDELISLLAERASALSRPLRMKLVSCLVLLRNKGHLDATSFFPILFKLFRIEDKALRAMLFSAVVTDIRNANKAKKQPKFNRQLQTFLRRQVEGDCPVVARRALDTIVELYRRRVWNDANTVNIMAQCCLSDFSKTSVGGIRFFLGINSEINRIEEEEEEARKEGGASDAANQMTRDQAKRMHQHSRPTRKRMRRKARAMAQVKKRSKVSRAPQVLFPAIEMLHDPNGFVDKLFRKLKKRQDVFATRLMIMDLLSRVIGLHKLVVPAFYSYVQRFLTAYQKDVARILAVLLQSCHAFTPAEDIHPLVRTIANNFIRDKCPPPVIAIGINSICGLFRRSEHILEEMQQEIEPLVKELAEFKKFKDKGVIIAARGFINTIREKFPALLPRRDRGKESDKEAKPKQYGQVGKRGSVQEDEAAAAVAAAEAEAEAAQVGSDSDAEDRPPQKRARADSDASDEDEWADFVLEDDSDDSDSDEGVDIADAVVVDPSILEGYAAKKKLSREERILNAAAGGNDYGKSKGGGSTNQEKKRRKNFGMIKHSQAVRDKLRKSYHDQVKSIKKRMAALQRQGNKRVKRGRR